MADKRLLGDWLSSYLEVTANLEAKESLHRWTGMVCLATALRRRVVAHMQHGPIYPNLYVFIVAESAKARKSSAMNYGKKLLIDTFPELRIFQDDMTPQGLIKYLYLRATKDVKGDKKPQGDFVLFADELANLFGTERNRSSKMVILLTTTFMCTDVYDHLTVRDSLERLYNLYPVVLAATDPSNLKVLPADAIGGLTGRIIWIIEREKRHVNPGWINPNDTATLRQTALRECLIHDLQCVSQMQGNMAFASDAQAMYDAWYQILSTKDERDPRTDAFYHRCHTTALQIAMLLSISNGNNMLVSAVHMANAIKLIEAQLPDIKRVTIWSGAGQYEQQRSKYITYLQGQGGKALRRNLLRYMGISVAEFDQVTITLTEDGTIESPRILGNETILQLTQKAITTNNNEKIS